MLAVCPRQIDTFGKAGKPEQHAGLAIVHPRLVLVQGFLLGQVALDQHPPTPFTLQAVEHVLHLLA